MIADIYDDRFVVCNSCAWGRGLQCCEGCSSLSFSVNTWCECRHLWLVSMLSGTAVELEQLSFVLLQLYTTEILTAQDISDFESFSSFIFNFLAK